MGTKSFSLHTAAWLLVMIGALNWLLVGVGGFAGADWNVVHMLLGAWPFVESSVYVLVGLAGVYEIIMHKSICKSCSDMPSGSGPMTSTM